ncbi:MAG: hypothetical protein AAF587_38800 [Bacteroidota bacterium]
MKDIYISETNAVQRQELIIEGDAHSVWAYVLNLPENKVKFDGFVCSRGTIVERSEEVKEFIAKGISPPLMKRYSNQYSIQTGLESRHIQIDWRENTISIKVREVDFLILDLENQISYTKAVSNNGPYGSPLTEIV